MTNRLRLALALALAATLAACTDDAATGTTARAACEDAQAALCERFYSCFTAEELTAAGLPATEAACTAMFTEMAGCATQTSANICDPGETYHPERAADCLDQYSALTCSLIRDGSEDQIDAATPACAAVCASR
ncbi:MAG: hypothetical protein K8W52_29895 [Deltaproteobacteria bacterium]|nr:hypothetical protein [Deltaproteobacteria bacterium]